MSKELPPSRTAEQFVVRFPDGMRDRIAEAAKANNRSMNAEINHILLTHLDSLGSEADALETAISKAERSNISIGLNDPVDRAAVLKVLLLDELMLLRRRVGSLGGPEAVLKLDKSEIVKKVEGPSLKGTAEEQKSHFSQILPTYPLTAILTNDELGRLAERVVAIQAAQSKPASKKNAAS